MPELLQKTIIHFYFPNLLIPISVLFIIKPKQNETDRFCIAALASPISSCNNDKKVKHKEKMKIAQQLKRPTILEI